MDLANLPRFIIALAIVLALIIGLSWLLRRYGAGLNLAPGLRGQRIGVVAFSPVDAKRRLALIRRDDVEHLVLLGPSGETVIERNIPAPPAQTSRPPVDAASPAGHPSSGT